MATLTPSSTFVHADDIEAVLHDIRGCLTIIRGQCLSTVRAGVRPPSTIESLQLIDEEVDRIADAMERVRHLLHERSPLSSMDETVDLAVVAARAVHRLHGVASARRVTLRQVSTARALAIRGRVDLFDRVLDNLVLNAVIAAGAGGDVGIVVDGDDSVISLRVVNRVQDGDDADAGWGLGMQIVRDIVAMHGGSLSYEGTGDSMTVSLEIPAAAAGEQ